MANNNFRQEEIPVIASMVRDSFRRDRALFEAYSPMFSEVYLNDFSTKITLVEERTQTGFFLAQLKTITGNLYQDIDNLRPIVLRLEGYLKLAKSSLNVSIADFGISDIRKKIAGKDAEGLISKMTMMMKLVDSNLTALTAVGFTPAAKTGIENLKNSIRDNNLNQNLKMDEKEAAVQNNTALLGELWNTVKEVMDVGVRLFKFEDPEKTGDYTMARIKSRIRHEVTQTEPEATPEAGIISVTVTDKSNDEPLEGVDVEIIEPEEVEQTDVDGECGFDAIPVGKYTVRAILEGYYEANIAGVEVVMDEETDVKIELEPEPVTP